MGSPVVHWDRMVETGGQGGINGGIMEPKRDDLAAYRKRVAAAGAKILIEEQEVPGMGALTLLSDPEGHMMGLWKAANT